jgi:hypothetical protein
MGSRVVLFVMVLYTSEAQVRPAGVSALGGGACGSSSENRSQYH